MVHLNPSLWWTRYISNSLIEPVSKPDFRRSRFECKKICRLCYSTQFVSQLFWNLVLRMNVWIGPFWNDGVTIRHGGSSRWYKSWDVFFATKHILEYTLWISTPWLLCVKYLYLNLKFTLDRVYLCSLGDFCSFFDNENVIQYSQRGAGRYPAPCCLHLIIS